MIKTEYPCVTIFLRPRLVAIVVLAALVLMASTRGAYAQPVPSPVKESRVVAYTATSTAIQLGTVLESFLYQYDYFPYLMLGTATLQNLPGIIAGAEPALGNTGIQLGLDAAYAGSQLVFGNNFATPLLFNAAHKYSMFATYDSYVSLRSRVEPSSSGYSDDYGAVASYSFFDLALAPFDYRVYNDWTMLGYLGSMSAFSVISMLATDRPNAVWSTGEAYLGANRVPVWAGIPLVLLLQVPNFILTGVGEEALYRGVYYEELSYRLGQWPAKIIDGVYFTLSHFPQNWDNIVSSPPQEVILNSLFTVAGAFWFQYVYEWRGLRSAVAAHAMGDVIVFFCDWLAQAGVPNHSGFSINERTLSIGMTLEL